MKRICLLIVFGMMFPWLSVRADWIGTRRVDDVAYFFFSLPARVERYDLAQRQWLTPLPLPTAHGLPTTAHADPDGLYVAYGSSVYRYDLQGQGQTHLVNSTEPISGLLSDGHLLFVNRSSSLYARLTSIDKNTNTLVDTFENYTDALNGFSIAPSINKIFGRSLGVSPADITYATYDDTGQLLSGGDSPHHGDYPGASMTWVFPGDGKVVDDSGTIYSTGNLAYLSSFGRPIDDLQFLGDDIPIILDGSTLAAYTNGLLPTGEVNLSGGPKNFYLHGQDAIVFSPSGSGNGIAVQTQPLASLSPPQPGAPVDPHGLPFTPDDAFLDRDGILLLFSRVHQSVFRWDPQSQEYLPTLSLVGVPNLAAYSSVSHCVYLAYDSGLIRRMDLNAAAPAEEPFATLPMTPLGLATADSYLFAVDGSGAWVTHYTFNTSGQLVSAVDWNYFSRDYVWNEAAQKMYFFRDDTSPNDLLWEEINANGMRYPGLAPGEIGTDLDSPLHTSTGFIHPIRVAPDGSSVVLGSGVIHDGASLERLNIALANPVADIAWLGTRISTMRTISDVTQYQAWGGATLSLGAVQQYPGEAHRLFALDATRLLGVSIGADGTPSLYVLDDAFRVIAPQSLAKPAAPVASIPAAGEVRLVWPDIAGETAYRVERQDAGGGPWLTVGNTATSITAFVDTGLSNGQVYEYRVIATHGTLVSPASDPVRVSLLFPDAPAPVIATPLSTSAIRVDWTNVSGETGYRIERRTNGGNWTTLASTAANVTTYTHSGLSVNTLYEYRVQAFNALGASAWESASASTFVAPPSTPQFGAPVASQTTITLGWTGGQYAESFVIERQQAGGPWIEIATVANSPLVDTGLTSGTDYSYRIKARNSVGDSAWSTVLAVSTTVPTPPSVPGLFIARPATATQIVLTWQLVPDADSYLIQRRGESGLWSTLATVPGHIGQYTDAGLASTQTYCYRISAVNVAGASAFAPESCAIPSDLVCLLESDFSDSMFLDWLTISGGSVISDGGMGFPAGEVLWFGSSGTRSMTTEPLDVRHGAFLEFTARGGHETRDGSAFWEDPDNGEEVVIEYSLDGQNWTGIETIDARPAAFGDWRNFLVEIPAVARSAATRFRWRQLSNSGASNDVWALDSFCVLAPLPAAPSPPGFVLVVSNAPDIVALYWQPVPEALSYRIERTEPGGQWTLVGETTGDQHYFTDENLTPGSPYAYRLSSLGSGGVSAVTRTYYVSTLSLLDVWLEFEAGQVPPQLAMAEFLASVNAHSVSALERYAYGLPADADVTSFDPVGYRRGLPLVSYDPETGGLVAEFFRRRAESNPQVSYCFEVSPNGESWVQISDATSVTPIDFEWEIARYVYIEQDASAARSCFGRVRVTHASH